MLKHLHLTDFKSFADQGVDLAPLTILVGANASGKSNLFDALRFLQGIGLGLTFTDILRGRWEGQREIWPGVRGGPQEVARKGSASFGITSTWSIGQASFTHDVVCRGNGDTLLEGERLVRTRPDDYLFDTHAPVLRTQAGLAEGGAIRVGVRRVGKGNSLALSYPATRSLLAQIEIAKSMDPRVTATNKQILAAMSGSIFLDISPRRMREYVPKQSAQLGVHGENISAIVWRLCQEPERKQDLVDWLSELCAPKLADIDFVETELGDVLVRLVEEGGTTISARSLSDGTLRFLGELAALLTAEEGSLVLIEEVENGLHPTRIRLLLELLESVTRKRKIQVLATSHSPAVLHALSPEVLGHAVVFGRLPDAPGTIMGRLADLPHFDEIVERRGIEHLFTTGWLERALRRSWSSPKIPRSTSIS